MVDALWVGIGVIHLSCPKKCGPSRSLFDQRTAPGVQIPYKFCVGICSGPGIWRTRSVLWPEQHWYLTHQHCVHEGHKLCNAPPMPTAPRRKRMDACRGRVSPSPVSLQISTNCLLELIKICCKTCCKGHCSCKKNNLPCTVLCIYHNSDCSNLHDYRMIADEDDVWLLQEVNKDDTIRGLCTTDLTHKVFNMACSVIDVLFMYV